ncbi:MAG: cyclase family protein [Acidimicrobiia bacterium]
MDLITAARDATVIDLAHPLERGIPVSPNHPGFEIAMMRRHGDMVRSDGGSAANEMFTLGGHVGTHIDALGHVSQDGRLYGGGDAAAASTNRGLSELGADTIPMIVTRGVMLDIAGVHGVETLDPGYEITVDDLNSAEELAGTSVQSGDAVLLRTGWSSHWDNTDTFRGQTGGAPGPGEPAAEWLLARDIMLAGGETIAFEVIRPGAGHATLPVHRRFLVDTGTYIVEVLNLDALAAAKAYVSLFILTPLKIVGGTGSPSRPIALVS